MIKKNSIFILFILGVVSLVSLSCNKRVDESRITFAQLPITYSAVTHIAEAKGSYKEEGLNVVTMSVPAGPDVISALRARGENAATVGSIAVTPVITMIASGDAPVVLATTLKSDRRVHLITFSETGITDDPSTLKEKTIGVVKNTVGDIYLTRLLNKGGLSNEDVKIVAGSPLDLKNLLLRGDLDAATLWDPFIEQTIREYKKQRGSNLVADRGNPEVFVDPGLYTLAFNVVTTKSMLDKNRPEIVKMLRAVIKAGDYIKTNPKDAQNQIETWLNLESGVLDEFMETTDFNVHLDAEQMKIWMREELEWLQSVRSDAVIPDDFSPYIDSSLLKEIDSTRVRE